MYYSVAGFPIEFMQFIFPSYCSLLSRTNMCQFYNPKRQIVFNASNTINYIFQLDSFHW